ncbi:hypothetical protein J437_LFUL012360, partial [Ladona fulva]
MNFRSGFGDVITKRGADRLLSSFDSLSWRKRREFGYRVAEYDSRYATASRRERTAKEWEPVDVRWREGRRCSVRRGTKPMVCGGNEWRRGMLRNRERSGGSKEGNDDPAYECSFCASGCGVVSSLGRRSGYVMRPFKVEDGGRSKRPLLLGALFLSEGLPSARDPRVNDWTMMASPFPTLFICLFYAYFAKVLGPRLMENRKPFDLRNVLIVYNAIQTVFSLWLFYE